MKSRPVIAVDIDDVLSASAKGFVEYSNKKWGTNLKPDDYDEHWAQIWQIDYEEELKRRDTILRERLFTRYSFFDEAKPALARLAKNYKLVIITSRGSHISKDTKEWIGLHFENIFSEIHFAKIWDQNHLHTTEKLKLTKAELCREAGASYLIDDHPKHCIAAAKLGIRTLLFGNYGWNKDTKLVPGMVRVRNWKEVLEYFDESGRQEF